MIDKKVKFTGNVEELLSWHPEKAYLDPYFKDTNEFIVTEIMSDIKGEPLIEIFVKIGEIHHYFNVSLEDIEFLN